MKVMFWIMKTKSTKSKLDSFLFIHIVYVVSFFFLLKLCHSAQFLDVFLFCFVILVNLHARNSYENEEKW